MLANMLSYICLSSGELTRRNFLHNHVYRLTDTLFLLALRNLDITVWVIWVPQLNFILIGIHSKFIQREFSKS